MLGSSEESVVQAKMVKESFKKKDGGDQEKKTRRKAFQLIKTAYINDPQTSSKSQYICRATCNISKLWANTPVYGSQKTVSNMYAISNCAEF